MADKKFAAFPQFLGIDPPVCARILVKCCVPTAERGNCVCALGLNHTEKYTAERLTVVHFTLFMRNQVGLLYFRRSASYCSQKVAFTATVSAHKVKI